MRRMGIDLDLQEVKDDEGAYDLRQAAEIHGRSCAEADQGENMNALRLAGIPVGARFFIRGYRAHQKGGERRTFLLHAFFV